MSTPSSSPYGTPAYPRPDPGNGPFDRGLPPASKTRAGWALGLSFGFFAPIAPVVSIFLAVGVLRDGRDGRDHGQGMAIAALVIAPLSFIVAVALVVLGVAFDDEESTTRDGREEVATGENLPRTRLQVGTCFNAQLEGGDQFETELVDAVSCSSPHQLEVFHDFQVDGDEYPGQRALDRAATGCVPAFETYVGLAYTKSRLELSYYAPTAQSWDVSGDRSITCVVFDPRKATTTGSFKGSRSR